MLPGLTPGSIKGALYTAGYTAVSAVVLGTFFVPDEQVVHTKDVWQEAREERGYRGITG